MGNYGVESWEYVNPGLDGGMLFLMFYGFFFLAAMAIGVAAYVLQSYSIYTIAKRRDIKKPWLAWIPVGVLWILGSLSDQYKYVTGREVKSKRKVLLGLSIAVLAVNAVMTIAIIGWITSMVGIGMMGSQPDHELLFQSAGLLITVLGTSLVTSVLAIVLVVFEYIALYDVFKSCEPDNAVAFLIISILFQIALPILLFVSRKKDLGMPPRKQEAACIQEESQTTWEENQAEDVE